MIQDLSDQYPVAFCNDCGKLFTKVSRNICFECKQKEASLVNKVAEYVKGHPGVLLDEVASNLNMNPDIIMRFISEGLLRRFKLDLKYPCKLCKAIISERLVCVKCSEDLKSQINTLRGNESENLDDSDSGKYEYKANPPRKP